MVKKHTVHTRHPRYNVPQYPRGSGGHAGNVNTGTPQPFNPKWLDGVDLTDLEQIYRNMWRNIYKSNAFGIDPYETRSSLALKIKRLYNEAVFNKRMNININDYLRQDVI